jgi:hypothetical protein
MEVTETYTEVIVVATAVDPRNEFLAVYDDPISEGLTDFIYLMDIELLTERMVRAPDLSQ